MEPKDVTLPNERSEPDAPDGQEPRAELSTGSLGSPVLTFIGGAPSVLRRLIDVCHPCSLKTWYDLHEGIAQFMEPSPLHDAQVQALSGLVGALCAAQGQDVVRRSPEAPPADRPLGPAAAGGVARAIPLQDGARVDGRGEDGLEPMAHARITDLQAQAGPVRLRESQLVPGVRASGAAEGAAAFPPPRDHPVALSIGSLGSPVLLLRGGAPFPLRWMASICARSLPFGWVDAQSEAALFMEPSDLHLALAEEAKGWILELCAERGLAAEPLPGALLREEMGKGEGPICAYRIGRMGSRPCEDAPKVAVTLERTPLLAEMRMALRRAGVAELWEVEGGRAAFGRESAASESEAGGAPVS